MGESRGGALKGPATQLLPSPLHHADKGKPLNGTFSTNVKKLKKKCSHQKKSIYSKYILSNMFGHTVLRRFSLKSPRLSNCDLVVATLFSL